ncbi:hypothetical protein L7F22_026731 [Adiantum nelumboides]|nr:hypothetical protein [Adiantum nelumboides]
MGRSKRIEWQYVEKIKALRKGQWTCKCNFCGHVWGGGPHRIRSHLLSLLGQGVGPCDSVTEDVKDIVRRLHADASSDGKDSREAIDALVDDLGGSASQSQGDASLSTHGEGSTHASGSSKSNVNSSKKRKVAQGAGGLPAAFGLQARKQADQALRRFFYAEDVPEWKVRSPYFLDMIKAIGNVGPSYVPPSYHALRTTELNDEVQCLKKEIMGVTERINYYAHDGDTIVEICGQAVDYLSLLKERLTNMEARFERLDEQEALPTGSKLLVCLSLSFTLWGEQSNKILDCALELKPKLIVLIAPLFSRRLDEHSTYNLIWSDDELLQSEILWPWGAMEVPSIVLDKKKGMSPTIFLWSRTDWATKHRQIASRFGHFKTSVLSGSKGQASTS